MSAYVLATGYKPGRQHHYAVYALTQTQDIRVLPILIKATRYTWGRHPNVSNAINRLLEQVTEADAGLLSDQAQQRLWAIRVGWQTSAEQHNPQVAISVLRALAAVGNHASYTRMEQLAHRSERFALEREVIAAAQELLPLMQARFQRQEVPQTLLRASDASNAAPDTLLRAAHITPTEPAAQLLRASTFEHPESDAYGQRK